MKSLITIIEEILLEDNRLSGLKNYLDTESNVDGRFVDAFMNIMNCHGCRRIPKISNGECFNIMKEVFHYPYDYGYANSHKPDHTPHDFRGPGTTIVKQTFKEYDILFNKNRKNILNRIRSINSNQ